jgi:competence ComEA-like helix-hairpin-helix protein
VSSRLRAWWDGLALTGPERTALLFFGAALLLGSAVEVYRWRFEDPLRDFRVIRAQAHPDAYKADSLSAPALDQLLDLNRATIEELEGLPGIGPVLARRIVEHRRNKGPFAAPEALREVPGIGPKKFAALRPHITVILGPVETED